MNKRSTLDAVPPKPAYLPKRRLLAEYEAIEARANDPLHPASVRAATLRRELGIAPPETPPPPPPPGPPEGERPSFPAHFPKSGG